MADKIVYTLVNQPGGVDGLDRTAKGGEIVAAFYTRKEAEDYKGKPWCNIVPIVIDDLQAKREAIKKLSPIDKLVLNVK